MTEAEKVTFEFWKTDYQNVVAENSVLRDRVNQAVEILKDYKACIHGYQKEVRMLKERNLIDRILNRYPKEEEE